MIEVMDSPNNGGNNDTFIQREEFMSYFGYYSDYFCAFEDVTENMIERE